MWLLSILYHTFYQDIFSLFSLTIPYFQNLWMQVIFLQKSWTGTEEKKNFLPIILADLKLILCTQDQIQSAILHIIKSCQTLSQQTGQLIMLSNLLWACISREIKNNHETLKWTLQGLQLFYPHLIVFLLTKLCKIDVEFKFRLYFTKLILTIVSSRLRTE